MKIILYELKKMLTPFFICVFLLLTAVNVFSVADNARHYDPFYGYDDMESLYTEHCEKISGPITDDTLKLITDKYNEASNALKGYDAGEPETEGWQGDYNVYSQIISELKQSYYYGKNMSETVKKAESNMQNSQPDSYQYKRNELIVKRYSGRSISAYYRTDGFEALFNCKFSLLLTLMLVVFAISPIMCSDREQGMHMLILSSKRGSRNLVCSKAAAAAILCCGTVIWFELVNIITVSVTNGLYGWGNPIYSIPSFEQTPYNLTIIGYELICVMLRAAAVFEIALAVILISSVSANGMISLVISFAVVSLLIILSDTVNSRGYAYTADRLNPMLLIDLTPQVTGFQTVNVFGVSLLYADASVIFGFIVSAALFILDLTLNRTAVHKQAGLFHKTENRNADRA